MILNLLRLLSPFAFYAVDPNAGGGADLGDEPEGAGEAAPNPEDGEADRDDLGAPPADKAPSEPVEDGMLKAIQAKVPVKGQEPAAEGPKGADGKPLTGAALAAHNAKAAADAKAAAASKAAGATSDEQRAAADAAAKQKREEEQAARLAGKKVADFALSKEERRALSQGAQQRFHDLHKLAKGYEDSLEKASAENKALAEARDNIMGALDDHKCTAEDLTELLAYNLAIKSGNWTKALDLVEAARTEILKNLGREAPGVDLLKEFPDLVKDVEEETLSRERALEIAKARRAAADHDQRRSETTQQERAYQAFESAKDAAANEIESWTKTLAGSDIDYKAKERIIMSPRGTEPSLLNQVMKDYHPKQWLPTLKMIYGNISISKAAAPSAPAENGLRPSGARAGSAQPSDMAHAIAGKLGYENLDLTGSA